MNNSHSFYAVTQSASETLSSTIFEDCFAAICFDNCEPIYCHFNEKKLLFKFLWLEFRFKSFLVLHVHFKGFMCISMCKLHAECQIPADAHD